MNVPRVIGKKAFEYAETFEPSLTAESLLIKSLLRTTIEESVVTLGYDQRAIFYQCVLESLQALRERVTNERPVHEPALDAIELQILSIKKLLKEANHQSHSVVATPKLLVKEQQSLEDQQQIALDQIAFMGGVDSQNLPIMSQKEFSDLIEHTKYLIRYGEVPSNVKQIKKTSMSNQKIRYTYRLIHDKLYGTKKIKPSFLHFLLTVFSQFENTAYETLYKNFAGVD